MKQFFKFLFASCLGTILALFAMIFIGGGMLAGVASQGDKPTKVSSNSVLHLQFNAPVPERTNNVQRQGFEIEPEDYLGLHTILKTLESAKEDDKIKGIFVEVDETSMGLATANSLREGIEDFKESEKFVIAYSKYYSQGAYYLASTADKVYVNPIGSVDFRGLASQVPFFKNFMDKAGIKMQIYYAGKFKSATEPYRRSNMSEQNKLQVREFLDDIYADFISDIAKSRDISESELKHIANEYYGYDPNLALEHGLVDVVGYRDEAINEIRTELGLEEKDKMKLVSLDDYEGTLEDKTNFKIKDQIAVVYAEGTINMGNTAEGTIGDEKYSKLIKKIRKNDKIKAVVLRVNSGGGSALASENILRELNLLQEADKPLIVSMGDYAASGGYWIAARADSIVAEPTTLTGSIGVFSMIPSVGELMNDKIGINFDTVKTAKYADGIGVYYDLDDGLGEILQKRTDDLYNMFLDLVASGRDMTRDEVHEIAQGRVWTGLKAKELGLVDEIGTLEDAIGMAAGMAELETYRLKEYPIVKDPITQLMEKLMGADKVLTESFIQSELDEWYPYYKMAKEIKNTEGPQARMPFILQH